MNIREYRRSLRNSSKTDRNEIPIPDPKNIISQEKKKDIISMMPWAPEVDKNYLNGFCN
jgi:hypothetical protein